MKPQKYLKAIVLMLDHYHDTKLVEKKFSISELEDARKWLATYDYGNNVCLCYEMYI